MKDAVFDMQNNPQLILSRLKKCSSTNKGFHFRRIYSSLYDIDFYKLVYEELCPRTKFNEDKIRETIRSLKEGTYLPKKTLEDTLVLEILVHLLEAIYSDVEFYRDPHSALRKVRTGFQGTTWFGCIHIQPSNLNFLNFFQKKIWDTRFLHLLKLFLKAKYFNNFDGNTYSGALHGTNFENLLLDLYLSQVDEYLNTLKTEYDTDKAYRKVNLEYNHMISIISRRKKALDRPDLDPVKRQMFLEEIRENRKKSKIYKGYSCDMMDPEYLKFRHVRYRNQILLGVIGSKKDATELFEKVKNFLNLAGIKYTFDGIQHRENKIRFLGYDIVEVIGSQKKQENLNIRLSVPFDVLKSFLEENKFTKWWLNPKSGKDELKAVHRKDLVHLEPINILRHYNRLLRGLYMYYSLAENVCKLGKFAYLLQVSFLRTLASKKKTSCAKLYKNKNFCRNRKIGVLDGTKFIEFFTGPFKKVLKNKYYSDLKPNPDMVFWN